MRFESEKVEFETVLVILLISILFNLFVVYVKETDPEYKHEVISMGSFSDDVSGNYIH